MTWSIIARDASGAFGIAIASKFFAVGALCPHIRTGVGAVATQALVNPLYGGTAWRGDWLPNASSSSSLPRMRAGLTASCT